MGLLGDQLRLLEPARNRLEANPVFPSWALEPPGARLCTPCPGMVAAFGSMRPRRQRLLAELQSRGLACRGLFRCYGRDRDVLIGRARIVLNMHQFKTSQLEQVRISYLLNNRCFVISETADCDPYGGGVIYCTSEGDARDAARRTSLPVWIPNATASLTSAVTSSRRFLCSKQLKWPLRSS